VSELQDLVDALAGDLGRPVGIDDRRFRSLAYSSHIEQVDQVRLSSILHRQAPKPVTDLLTAMRIEHAEDVVRIPANPALGMRARACLPLRLDDALLGYLWLFDEPTPLDDGQLDLARHVASSAAAVLFRLRRLESADRARERELLAELLGVRRGDARRAAETLVSVGLLAPAPSFQVVVLQAVSAAGGAVDDPVRVRLASAADRLRRAALPHHVIHTPAGDHVVVLTGVPDGPTLERWVGKLLEAAGALLAADAQWSPLIGVSGSIATPERAAEAYREARWAAGVAAAVPEGDPVVHWTELGAYRTILRLAHADDTQAAVPASVRALLEASDAASLVPTLEAYLDHAGDARATAHALFLHRSTLYKRLSRIEEIAGVSLRSGDDRLELHLGLRVRRLRDRAGP
jgi:hypothetical protein